MKPIESSAIVHPQSPILQLPQEDKAGERPLEEKFDVLGKLAWLWMASPLHKDWVVRLQSSFILPAIETGQYVLIEREGLPVAYCSWAFLSTEAEMQYIEDASTIPALNWQSGDHLWFVDWVAPFSRADSLKMVSALKRRFPDNVARAIRVKQNNPKARVMEFIGPKANVREARHRLLGYHRDWLELLSKKA